MQVEVIRAFPSGKYELGEVVNLSDFPRHRGQQLINTRWLKPVIPDSDKCKVLRNFSSYRIGEEVDTTGWRNKAKLIALGKIVPIAEPIAEPIVELPVEIPKERKKTRKRRKR